jgi:hypothetical protein
MRKVILLSAAALTLAFAVAPAQARHHGRWCLEEEHAAGKASCFLTKHACMAAKTGNVDRCSWSAHGIRG